MPIALKSNPLGALLNTDGLIFTEPFTLGKAPGKKLLSIMFQVPFLLFHGSGLYIPIWLQTMGWEEKTSTLLPVNEKPESKDEPVHSPQQRASGCITSTWAVLAHLVILGSWVSIAVWVSRRGGLSGPHNLNRPYCEFTTSRFVYFLEDLC